MPEEIRKITRDDIIQKLAAFDVENTNDEVLMDVFENGVPGYHIRSNQALKQLYIAYIDEDATDDMFDLENVEPINKPLTRQTVIDRLVTHDMEQAENEKDVLRDLFENGTPGYHDRSDDTLKSLYRIYIDDTVSEDDFQF